MCNDLAQTYFELGQHERAEELFEESGTSPFFFPTFSFGRVNHRENGGKTLGMGGPLITPYITWVFIGYIYPLLKGSPTRGLKG